jgi:hypothetical protein
MNHQGALMRRNAWKHRTGVFMAMPLALVIATCGDSGRQQDAPADSVAVQQEEPMGGMRGYRTSDSVKPGTLGPPGTGEKVAVTLTEWAIAIAPDSIGSGPATFLIQNKGERTHKVVVRHEHHGNFTTVPIPPGGVVELSMPLTFADFEIFCPIEDMAGNHREKGMLKIIKVR